MLLFLYGPDSYRSWRKVAALKARYIDASLGDTNLTQLDMARVSLDQFTNQLLVLPFLAKTRLVILDRLLSDGSKPIQEQFTELLGKLPDTTVAVVYEPGVPDRRTSLFKTLLKTAKVEEFTPLVGVQLTAWLNEELQPLGVTITPKAAAVLAARTSGDTWRMATESQKLGLAVLADGQATIDEALVTALVRDTQAPDSFALGNAVAEGNTARTLAIFHTLMAQGESPQYLVALVANTIRNLALIRDCLDAGVTNPAAIASTTKLNPFVVKLNLSAATRLSARQIADLMAHLAALDLDSKRGKIEAEVGLELFLVRATQVA